jgi:bacillithiol system protein YtxJ
MADDSLPEEENPMSSPFLSLTDVPALEAQVRASHTQPVVLFQHDPHCGASRAAFREMTQVPEPVCLIDVTEQRDLSRRSTEQTGIRHESPQVLVLRDGVAVWSASHRAITAAAVAAALQQQPLAVQHAVSAEGTRQYTSNATSLR